jgi:all-trans-nonaprenyl-diphosphate synthase
VHFRGLGVIYDLDIDA